MEKLNGVPQVTVSNFQNLSKNIDFSKMPEPLVDGKEFVDENLDLYNYDESIKKYIDTYVNKLNAALMTKKPAETKPKPSEKKEVSVKKAKPAPVKKAKKAVSHKKEAPKPAPKAKKQAPKKPVSEAKPVAVISPEVRFIKRYVRMDGQRKTRKQLLTFINALQRAIEKKQIRKTSSYAKEIMHIQNELIKIYNNPEVGETFKFMLDESDKGVLNKFQKIAGSQKQRASVRLISRYIGIHGKTNVKEKAERLLKAIRLAFKKQQVPANDPYRAELKKVQANLETFVKAKESRLKINSTDLKGLQGIAGMGLINYDDDIKPGDRVLSPFGERGTVEKVIGHTVSLKEYPGRLIKKEFLQKIGQRPVKVNKKKPQKVDGHLGAINAVDFAGLNYKTFGFTGKWKNIIGDPSIPFNLMFFSKPGLGKSSLAIELAKYMADTFDCKILFVAVEEGLSYTLKDKFQRMKAFSPNISIVEELPNDLSDYDVVMIDSVNRLKMSADDFMSLKNKYPQKSFVLIFQTTKEGLFRGSNEWEHEVDVSININDNGYAAAVKTRFGGTGTIKVFSGKADPVYKFSTLQDAEKFVANRDKEKLSIVEGNDGKKWVTNPDKARELKAQGYEIY